MIGVLLMHNIMEFYKTRMRNIPIFDAPGLGRGQPLFEESMGTLTTAKHIYRVTHVIIDTEEYRELDKFAIKHNKNLFVLNLIFGLICLVMFVHFRIAHLLFHTYL